MVAEKSKREAGAGVGNQECRLDLRISRLGKKRGKRQLAILRGYLRAEGRLQPVEVRAMLDTGANGEFMTRELARKMGAQITEGNFGVAVEAFGKRTRLQHKVAAAELSLPGVNPRTSLSESLVTKWDFIVAERLDDSYDLILGLEFMRKFGARFAFNHDPAQLTFTDDRGRDITVREEEEEHRESEQEELGAEKFQRKKQEQEERNRISAIAKLNECPRRLTGSQRRLLRRYTEDDAEERHVAALRAQKECPELVMPFDEFIHQWHEDSQREEGDRKMRVFAVQALGRVEEREQELHTARVKIVAGVSTEDSADDDGNQLEGPERAAADGKLQKLLQKFKHVFPKELPALGKDVERGSEPFKIELKPGTSPFGRYGSRMTAEDTETARTMLKELLQKGFIRPSQSPWGSPMFLVDKPQSPGEKRMVIDYRALNAATIRNRYPLPRVDELFDQLQGAMYFSKIDLRTGYWQIKIAAEDVPKTAFTSRHGHYEWLVLPMGLTNAPAAFMSLMENTFREELDKFVLVFLDDILVYSRTLEEHERHLEQVLERLAANKLYAKMSKCEFFRQEVQFLGHMVGRKGVRMQDDKVRAVREWPTPSCQKEVEQFLGLAGYYRKFIKDFSKLAAPLSELTGTPGKGKKKAGTASKKPFVWENKQDEAFRRLQAAICVAPVLALPDPRKEFLVQTDASGYATGAVLLQAYPGGNRPIAFLSKKMDKAERNYPVHEQELLAIMNALKAWRHYLGGRHFTVLSDHESLQYVKTSEMATPRQVRWASHMAEFDFEIKYVPGEANAAADALSRGAAGGPEEERLITSIMRHHREQRAIHVSAAVELAPLPVKIAAAAQRDQEYAELLQQTRGQLEHRGLVKGSGIIYQQVGEEWVMRVPNDERLRTYLLQAAHDTLFGGHRGAAATAEWLKKRVYWQGMDEEVKRYVRSCDPCSRSKPDNRGRQGLPMSIDMPNRPWACWCMDFIGPLPKTVRGHDMIMTVIDKFTRYTYYIPMSTKATAQEVFSLLERYVLAERDMPEFIISDRDSKFTSHFWQSLWQEWGTKLKRSTAFHPQTDGLTERANRTLVEMLRSFVDADQLNWDVLLPWMQIANNDAKCQSTGKTPFEMNNGRTRRTLLDVELQAAGVATRGAYPGAKELADRIKKIHSEATQLAIKAQEKQRKDSEQGRREAEIKAGDKVYLSRENLREKFGDAERARKLEARFYGPFLVEAMVGPNAARLKLPNGWKIHNEINLEYLKLYVDGQAAFPDRVGHNDRPGPELENDPAAGGPARVEPEDPTYEVEAIIGRKQRGGDVQYKVKWKGWPIEFASWEGLDNLENSMELVEEYDHAQPRNGRRQRRANGIRRAVTEQEAAVQREQARKAARENVGVEAAQRGPAPDKNGEVRMPSQRCTADTKRGQQCRQWTRHGEYCWQHLAQIKGARIKSSTLGAGAGKGLFAARDLKKDDVFDYTGDYVRLGAGQNRAGTESAYILELTEQLGIDAARTNTAEGRFVNDARGSGKRNNCRFSVNQHTKTAKLRVLRNIKAGEELFVAYGRGYWKQTEANKQLPGAAGSKQQPIVVSRIQLAAEAKRREKIVGNVPNVRELYQQWQRARLIARLCRAICVNVSEQGRAA